MKPLLRQHGGYCPLIKISALLSHCSSTTLSVVAHHNKEILYISLALFYLNQHHYHLWNLSCSNCSYSFIRLCIVLSATQIIPDISLIVKPSSNKFSSISFGMLNLGAPDWLGNFFEVYLPYLEQYTRRLIISLEPDS